MQSLVSKSPRGDRQACCDALRTQRRARREPPSASPAAKSLPPLSSSPSARDCSDARLAIVRWPGPCLCAPLCARTASPSRLRAHARDARLAQVHVTCDAAYHCPICLEPPVAARLTKCGHVYCWPCLQVPHLLLAASLVDRKGADRSQSSAASSLRNAEDDRRRPPPPRSFQSGWDGGWRSRGGVTWNR